MPHKVCLVTARFRVARREWSPTGVPISSQTERLLANQGQTLKPKQQAVIFFELKNKVFSLTVFMSLLSVEAVQNTYKFNFRK
jgi:hypothetical protein